MHTMILKLGSSVYLGITVNFHVFARRYSGINFGPFKTPLKLPRLHFEQGLAMRTIILIVGASVHKALCRRVAHNAY